MYRKWVILILCWMGVWTTILWGWWRLQSIESQRQADRESRVLFHTWKRLRAQGSKLQAWSNEASYRCEDPRIAWLNVEEELRRLAETMEVNNVVLRVPHEERFREFSQGRTGIVVEGHAKGDPVKLLGWLALVEKQQSHLAIDFLDVHRIIKATSPKIDSDGGQGVRLKDRPKSGGWVTNFRATFYVEAGS